MDGHDVLGGLPECREGKNMKGGRDFNWANNWCSDLGLCLRSKETDAETNCARGNHSRTFKEIRKGNLQWTRATEKAAHQTFWIILKKKGKGGEKPEV